MKDHMYYANHPLMYIACSIGILLVLFQAAVVLKKTIKCAKEKDMDEERIKKGITTSLISSIGPALGIVGSILALIVSLGAPVTAMRMSVIGGTNYETMAANFGAKAMGSELSTSMDPATFANALWVPALGVFGWLIIMFFFGHKMDKINNLLTGGRKALLPAVSVGAMLGAFAYFNVGNLMKISSEPSLAVTTIAGFVIMVICQTIGKNVNWLKQWSLTFAMFGGAIVGSFFI